MHYHAEVWIPNLDIDVERQIEEIMIPHRENYDDETEQLSGFWDWWQIGGRFSGSHTDYEYDPSKDERNIETCTICNGTGMRADKIGNDIRETDPEFTCNSCNGTGRSVLWPTQWAPFELDIMPVSDIKDSLKCYTLIVGDKIIHVETYCSGDGFVKTEFDGYVKSKLNELGITDGYLVTVDYHC